MTIAGLKNNSGRLPAEDQNASVANHSYGSRTRVFAVKGRCLNHLTNERYEGIARIGISPTTLSLHVRYTIIILPANHNAAYTKQSRYFLSIPYLCISDDISNYIEISVNNGCLECCRRHSYASVGTRTPQPPCSAQGALPLSYGALELIQTKSERPFYLELESTRIPEERPLYSMFTGVAGFEPTNDGVKVRCLTAWLYPKNWS